MRSHYEESGDRSDWPGSGAHFAEKWELIDASIFRAARQTPFGRDQAARLFATTGNVAVVGGNVCASGHTKSPVATGTCMPVGRTKPAFQK